MTSRIWFRRFGRVGSVMFAVGLCSAALVACGDDATPVPTPDSGTPRPDAGLPPDDGGTPADDAGTRALVGANPLMNSDIQGEQGYWYSRYAMNTLAMASGMGEVIDPASTTDPYAAMVGAAMPAMIDMANDCMAADTTCVPPLYAPTSSPMPQVPANIFDLLHPALITRIYDSGDPSLQNAFDAANPMDTLNLRFVPRATVPATTTTASYAWLAIKEIEWARQFHVDPHFGVPGATDEQPLAQTRFFGEVIFAEALMQTKVLLDDTVDMTTLTPTFRTPSRFDWSSPAGNYAVLLALSDLVGTLRGDAAAGNVLCTTDIECSSTNRYRAMGTMMAEMLLGAGMTADNLATMFLDAAHMLAASPMIPAAPADLRAAVVATQAFTWLASIETDPAMRDQAKARLRVAADAVLALPKSNSVDQAAAIRALAEAYRVLGDASYKTGAHEAWAALVAHYDPATGRWTDVDTYTADDLAFLFGGLNAYGTYHAASLGVPDADAAQATVMLLDSFESIMDLGRFQLSAPPATVPFIPEGEHQPTDLWHRYPSLPVPPAVTPSTANNGVAPVFGKSIRWTGAAWTVDRSVVETAGSMHLANELLWFHSDEISGFPTVR